MKIARIIIAWVLLAPMFILSALSIIRGVVSFAEMLPKVGYAIIGLSAAGFVILWLDHRKLKKEERQEELRQVTAVD